MPHVFNVHGMILNAAGLLRLSSLGLCGIVLSSQGKHEEAEEITPNEHHNYTSEHEPFLEAFSTRWSSSQEAVP